MLKAIGKAKVNTEGLSDVLSRWISDVHESSNAGNGDPVWKKLYEVFSGTCSKNDFYEISNLHAHFLWHPVQGVFGRPIEETAKRLAGEVEALVEYSEKYDCAFKCIYTCDEFAFITLGSKKSSLLLPSSCVTVTLYQDYDNLSAAERRVLLGGGTADAGATDVAVYGESLVEAREEQTQAAGKLEDMKQQIKDVEEAKTEELAKLQKEIDEKIAALKAKQDAMLSELNARKAEMELQFEKMKLQIHLLDSEIYAIRCYTGEVVEFHKVRSGSPAAPATPLVFYQKLRYLDEELGKLASIYSVDFGKAKLFENLLAHSPQALDVFAPSSRSIMLARVSRSNRHFGDSEDYINMLDAYEVYHGKRICIILRDGDNLWVGWTDDERVVFDGDAFLRPSGPRALTPEEEEKLKQGTYEPDVAYEKRLRDMKMKELDNGISRQFVYSVLQGAFDRGMVAFPEKVSIQKGSPYIVLSYAEGWLDDNRYGTLSDMIKKCNSSLATGDSILTVQGLRAEQPTRENGWRSSTWSNDRGIGSKNRTHDVQASTREIYLINKVVHEAVYRTLYRGRGGDDDIFREYETLSDEEVRAYSTDGRFGRFKLVSCEKLEDEHEETRYYISLEKDANWRTGARSRANFQVYEDEFWNLTFMNSRWIEYILTTQKATNISIGGTRVDFAHVIPYLKTALEHVRAREEQFAAWMETSLPGSTNDAEWPVKLSAWMLENNIHNFSEFRAKQFVKWLKENDKTGE